jgi:hypothetical protein
MSPLPSSLELILNSATRKNLEAEKEQKFDLPNNPARLSSV